MFFLQVVDGVLAAIGRTPVVRLKRLAPPDSAEVFVKLEYFNPTGSYKDRMALAMIEGAEARGALRPGMRVVECRRQHGSSQAMVCAVKNARVRAALVGCVRRGEDPNDEGVRRGGGDRAERRRQGNAGIVRPFQGADRRRPGDEPGTFWTDQFHNADALNGYRQIGAELLAQLATVDAFCGAVGTAGMLVGVSRALKEEGSRARIVALEPDSSRCSRPAAADRIVSKVSRRASCLRT